MAQVKRTLAFYLGMQLPQQPAGEGPQRRSEKPQGLEDKDQFPNHASSLLCPFPTGWGHRWGGIQLVVQAEEAGSLEFCAEKA